MVSGSHHTVSFSRTCAIFEIINQNCILLMRQIGSCVFSCPKLAFPHPHHVGCYSGTRNMQRQDAFPPLAGEKAQQRCAPAE
jgi:hypothetical protein